MLKELRIQNLILVSSAAIYFEKGLNVLSGETGSGKSAVIKALHLLAGEKTDTSIIRLGADKCIVEGFFAIEKIPGLLALLKEHEIDHAEGEDLIIRREISQAGKSRCTVNNHATQITLLRKISEYLLEMIGQHASQKLLSLEQHRLIVDLFGDLVLESKEFALSLEKENKLAATLEELINSEAVRLREIDVCERELEELREANLKDGEEEELFAEYSKLVNAEEIASKTAEIFQTLNGDRISLLNSLKKHSQIFEQLCLLDPSYKEMAETHKNAWMELQEIAYALEKNHAHIEYNPEKLQFINDRLTLLNKLKRKYGDTLSTIQAYQEEQEKKLAALVSADTQIDEGKEELVILKKATQYLAEQLTEKRRRAAAALQTSVTKQLQLLNMPKVEFEIEIRPQKRTANGDDCIEFHLIPNVGERKIPLKEHASGGELSRVMLALQTLLAGKEEISTLIFDEIDANIGGATAVVIGEKLKEIGKNHQVLCITHFSQVAKQADHHIQIEKREVEGRTLTHISSLDSKGRKKELERMQGV